MMRRARLDLEDDKVRGTGTSHGSELDLRLDDKRTYRLYAEEGSSIRTKLPRRKRAWRYRQGRPGAAAPNEIWAMDFMSGGPFDGRPTRILTVVDIHTREALSTHPRAHFRAAQVLEILDGLVRLRGNGPDAVNLPIQFDVRASPKGAFLIGDPKTVAAKMLKASETLCGLSRITFQMSTSLAGDSHDEAFNRTFGH